jgi:hypothetical protein
LLEALREHYDFLDDKQPRGVDVLARAVAALGVKEAAPLLAAQLGDHETPEPALKDVVATLARLAGANDAEATRALREFLLMYRADAVFLQDPAPLGIAGEALIRAGVEAKKTVAFVAEDKRTLAPLARQLRLALDAAAEADEALKKKSEPEAAPEKQE